MTSANINPINTARIAVAPTHLVFFRRTKNNATTRKSQAFSPHIVIILKNGVKKKPNLSHKL